MQKVFLVGLCILGLPSTVCLAAGAEDREPDLSAVDWCSSAPIPDNIKSKPLLKEQPVAAFGDEYTVGWCKSRLPTKVWCAFRNADFPRGYEAFCRGLGGSPCGPNKEFPGWIRNTGYIHAPTDVTLRFRNNSSAVRLLTIYADAPFSGGSTPCPR